MPGTMFINAAELAALPTTGAPWNRVVATSTADAGTPNLANLDSIVQTKVLVQALRWARDGGGVGRTAIINKIKAIPGTENATSQPLNVYRQVGTWIAAADLVDMPGSTVCANGMTWDAWVASLPDKVMNGQSNWNTLRKCARTSGNNWGNCARGSLLAVGLWLNNSAIITEVTNYDRRWLGDTSIPNTFTPTGAFSTGWDGPNTSYPTQQGVINPVSSNAALNGANCEDASRGSSSPPLIASGASYSMEAMDAMLFGAVLHHHAGKTDVWQWSDSAIKRNAVSINANGDNWSAANHIYWHETPLINHIYGTNLPVKTSDSYGSRAMPYCSDWLVQGNYLRTGTNGGGGGGGETPIAVPPDVNATVSVNAGVVTINAATTVAGTNPIARHLINWGDGVTDTLTEPTRSGSHTYGSAGTKTITITAVDTTGLTDVMQLQASTTSDQPPVASFTLSATTGPAPLATVMNSSASFDPDGTGLARFIDWGDGTTTSSAAATESHTYTASGTFTVRLDVTSNGVTRSVISTVQVTDPAVQTATAPYTMINGRPVPVLPAYDSSWNGWHPRWGSYRLWFDSDGKLRAKNGAPTFDTDGTEVVGGIGSGTGELTAEQVRDIIMSTVVAGDNVTVTVDDAADTVTVSAEGGGLTGTQIVADPAVRSAFASGVMLTDLTAAGLTAAAAAAGAGGVVILPPGQTVVLEAPVTLTGVGLVCATGVAQISVPTSLGTGVAALTLTGNADNIELANITITGPGPRSLGVKTANCDGIAVTGQAKPKLRNVTIRQFDTGLVWNNDVGHIYHHGINVSDNYYGIYCKKNTFDYFVTDSLINGNTFANFATPADQGFAGMVVQNTHCGFAPYGFYQEPTPAAQGSPKVFLQDVLLRHVRFEAIGNGAILTDATQDASNKSITSNLMIEHPGFSWSVNYRIGARARDYAVSLNQTDRVIEIVVGANPFLAGDINRIRIKQAAHEAFILRGHAAGAATSHVTTDAGTPNVVALAAPPAAGAALTASSVTISGAGNDANLDFSTAMSNRYVRFNGSVVRLGGSNADFNADFSGEFAWRNSGGSYAKVGRVSTAGIAMPNYYMGTGGSTTGPRLTSGTGTPEGVVTSPVGSLYVRTDGGATTTLYVKETGTGNTGWVAK